MPLSEASKALICRGKMWVIASRRGALRDRQEPVGCGIVVVAQLVRARRVTDRAARRRGARKRLVVHQKRPGHADVPSVLDIFVSRAGPGGHRGVPGPGGAVLPPSPGWASS